MQIVFHFIPERGHAQRFFESLVQHLSIAHAVEAQADDDILLDRHGRERIRFLENHPDAPADHRRIHSGAVEIFALEQDLPSIRVFGTSSCMRLRQRRKVDLPQPLGPMIAVTVALECRS